MKSKPKVLWECILNINQMCREMTSWKWTKRVVKVYHEKVSWNLGNDFIFHHRVHHDTFSRHCFTTLSHDTLSLHVITTLHHDVDDVGSIRCFTSSFYHGLPRCLFTILFQDVISRHYNHIQDVYSRHTITTHYHDNLPRYWFTMPFQDTLSRYYINIIFQDVASRHKITI